MIGLGKMGANMVRRLSADGHEVVVYDVDATVASSLESELDNVKAVNTTKELITELSPPRAIWLMVPHQYVDESIETLISEGISKGDLIIDGGNSNFNLSKQRAETLMESGLHFVDSGTSGGV